MSNKAPATSPPDGEIVIKGIAASPGIAVGLAYLYAKHLPHVQLKEIRHAEVDAEIARLRAAIERADKELTKILAFAEQKLGPNSARIFEAQILILKDRILMDAIEKRIREELRNAEYIVFDEIGKYKRLMLAAPDEYMHERAHDVDDVMNRIIRNIQDQKLFSRLEGESIIVSESLAPADTVIFSRNQVLAYVTDFGGVTSHAALLSRSLKIPAVVGLQTATRHIQTGNLLAVDGYGGTVVVHPSTETLENLRHKAERFRKFEQQLADLTELPAETLDHRRIELSANIEFADEIEFVRVQGSAGIGLYRTEGQLIGRDTYPTEDEQFREYKAIADAVYPHTVIFRTFDVGGDKVAPGAYREENPFLGWRGIRVSLDKPGPFLTQLRAILRASTRRNVCVMFPMVASLKEVRRAREFLEQAKEELKSRGVPFDERIKVGIMIEVPAVALLADELAAEVDFFSIGTNDLVQYLLAVDRGNNAVAPLYQELHPAVIRTIKMVADAAHRHNIWVGMCGEMAANPLATVLLIGLGLDELSVNPFVLPEIKKVIRSIRHKDARKIAEKILTMATEDEIREHLASIVKKAVPDIPLES